MSTWRWIVALFTCGWDKWRAAIWEATVVGFVSLIPLLVAALRDALPPSGPNLPVSFGQALLGGQLLFYAMGFIATVVWESQKDREQKFPLRGLLLLYCLSGIAICSAIIGFDPKLEHTKTDLLAWLSPLLFFSSMTFYVIVQIVKEIDGSEFTIQMEEESKSLADDLAARKRKNPMQEAE